MANWKCFKCNAEMEEVDDIKLFYNDIDLPEASGFRCPDCKVEYLDGEYVVSELSAAEQMLEGK